MKKVNANTTWLTLSSCCTPNPLLPFKEIQAPSLKLNTRMNSAVPINKGRVIFRESLIESCWHLRAGPLMGGLQKNSHSLALLVRNLEFTRVSTNFCISWGQEGGRSLWSNYVDNQLQNDFYIFSEFKNLYQGRGSKLEGVANFEAQTVRERRGVWTLIGNAEQPRSSNFSP